MMHGAYSVKIQYFQMYTEVFENIQFNKLYACL